VQKKTANWIRGSELNVFADFYAAQNKIDVFESTTKGASVFGFSVTTDVKCFHQWISIFVRANNCTNVSYYDHLSRLKEVGIHSMGRNVTFGVSVPFNFKK
jgi:iron complex outermembrane receptor protein